MLFISFEKGVRIGREAGLLVSCGGLSGRP